VPTSRAVKQTRHIVTQEMITSRDWHRKQVPVYKAEETARVFFGMSVSWLRRLLRPDDEHPETWFTYEDGTRIEFRRSQGRSGGARNFWLSDIEDMAYSLLRYGAIDRAKLARVMQVVQAEAYLFGLFDDLDTDPEPEPAVAGA